MSTLELTTTRAELLEMVDQVAQTMLSSPVTDSEAFSGTAFSSADLAFRYGISLYSPQSTFDVVLGCSEQSAMALASTMTAKVGAELSQKLVDDAMGEWLNVLAGQIKSLNALGHAMGLPKRKLGERRDANMTSGLRIHIGGTPVDLWIGVAGAHLRSSD